MTEVGQAKGSLLWSGLRITHRHSMVCVRLEERREIQTSVCSTSGGVAFPEDFGSFLHGPTSSSFVGFLLFKIQKAARFLPIQMFYEFYVMDIVQANKTYSKEF